MDEINQTDGQPTTSDQPPAPSTTEQTANGAASATTSATNGDSGQSEQSPAPAPEDNDSTKKEPTSGKKRGPKPKDSGSAINNPVDQPPASANAKQPAEIQPSPVLTITVTNTGADFYEVHTRSMLDRDAEKTLNCKNELQKLAVLKNFEQLNDLAGYKRFVVGE